MNKLLQIVNNKWFPYAFFAVAVAISVFQHYRVFSLDVIGYHSWRQTQTQQVIENFANIDFNILNPRLNDLHYPNGVYRMEFPLAQWLVGGLYRIFGNHLIISRLFFFVCTLFSVFGMFKVISLLTENKILKFLGAWFFLFSPIIYFYSVNPMPDNLALCMAIWALYFWVSYQKKKQNSDFILSCVFLMLAVAVKLPFIVYGAMYLPRIYQNRKVNFKFIIIPVLVCLPALVWYVCVIGTWMENGVVQGMLGNDLEILKLLGILQFNVLSTMPELLVNYATFPLFVIGVYYTYKFFSKRNEIHASLAFVGVCCIVYFLYELNMIEKVHDYYLFPFLPLLFIVVVKGVDVILSKPQSKLKYLVVLSFFLCPITAYLRCNTRWNEQSPGFPKEYLFEKKRLQEIIPYNSPVVVYNDESRSIVLYHLKRKGWSHYKYGFKREILKDNIKNGARFLITDLPLDTNQAICHHLDKLLFVKNNVTLYSIK